MKVILLKDIAKVGKKYEVKQVSDGFAMNFLLKNGGAKVATTEALKSIDELKKAHDAERKIQEDLLEKTIHELENKEVIVKAKANEKGHLFAGIHKENLVKDIFNDLHINLDANFIEIPRPIKEVGPHEVIIKANDKKTKIKVIVEAM